MGSHLFETAPTEKNSSDKADDVFLFKIQLNYGLILNPPGPEGMSVYSIVNLS